MPKALFDLQKQIITCTRCPRLVAWREKVAREKIKRFAEEKYWGKPLPSFGDPSARLLIVGLAPAAHGGNRTGRMFTGDRSGDWLYRALYKAGFANQPTSIHRNDGLKLVDCYITATIRCAPPQNKPARDEIWNCRPYLLREIELLKNVRVVVGLGKIGFDHSFSALAELYNLPLSPRPKFAHATEHRLNSHLTLLGSFHPSQQNTFTGRLTEAMFDRVFSRALQLLERS
jgi:uracil-DNA glycosylase family 4